MTWRISDTFNDPYGRWPNGSAWDGTEHSDGDTGFLSTQEHVDIRNFKVFIEKVAVPQTDLDVLPQTDLDGELQTDMEEKLAAPIKNENWVDDSGTGLVYSGLGEIPGRGGWSGLQYETNGSAIDITISSKTITHPVDISFMDHVTAVFPDYNTFDGTSTFTLSSDPLGTFGTGHDSAARPFSANGSTMPLLAFTIGSLANTGFDPTAVTAVRFHLKKAVAPSASLVMTIMAIRAITDDWEESALDIDTRMGAAVVPVTLDGAPYSGTVAQAFEFVRGDNTKNDPIPADGSYYLYFQPGGQTTPNDATGGPVNKLAFILREQKNLSDGTGSHIEARLLFDDSATTFEAANVSSTGGSPGTVTDTVIYTESVGPALDGFKHYVFRVEVRGTQIQASLIETDINFVLGDFVWQNSNTITDSSFEWKNGRVGFIADLISRDASLWAFDVSPTGFAMFQTNRYVSRTPVDGVQIAAVYSPDVNLFDTADNTGGDLFIDQTKTLSGLGSFRTQKSLATNSFLVDDWTQMYLNLAIWVPNNVTEANQPIILLNTDSGQENIFVPRLQPSQWNLLEFDLGIFRNLITAATYSITFQAAPNPDRALGYFWLDNIVVGRRRVAWSARATTDGLWREFKGMVNDPKGALHFTTEERGNQLQLQAVALTDDAWVSSFKLFPRYAQLGLPIYDQGFESD